MRLAEVAEHKGKDVEEGERKGGKCRSTKGKERKEKKNFRCESPRTFINLTIWLYRDLIKRDRRLFFFLSTIEGRL